MSVRLGAWESSPASGSDGARVRARWHPRSTILSLTLQAGADVGLKEQLGCPGAVLYALAVLERWDGRGCGRSAGEAIPLPARIGAAVRSFSSAHRREAWRRSSVAESAVCSVLSRPRPCVISQAQELFDGIDGVGTWPMVLGRRPALTVFLSGKELDVGVAGIASFVDLKSPYTLGQSLAVDRTRRGGRRHCLSPGAAFDALRRPGLVHTSAAWVSRTRLYKSCPLGAVEWERLRITRLQPTDAPAVRALAPLAHRPCSTASAWTARGIHAGCRNAISAAGADPRGGQRLSGHARASLPIVAAASRALDAASELRSEARGVRLYAVRESVLTVAVTGAPSP